MIDASAEPTVHLGVLTRLSRPFRFRINMMYVTMYHVYPTNTALPVPTGKGLYPLASGWRGEGGVGTRTCNLKVVASRRIVPDTGEGGIGHRHRHHLLPR